MSRHGILAPSAGLPLPITKKSRRSRTGWASPITCERVTVRNSSRRTMPVREMKFRGGRLLVSAVGCGVAEAREPLHSPSHVRQPPRQSVGRWWDVGTGSRAFRPSLPIAPIKWVIRSYDRLLKMELTNATWLQLDHREMDIDLVVNQFGARRVREASNGELDSAIDRLIDCRGTER